MDEIERARQEATDAAGPGGFLERLAERVGMNAQASAVFGEPVRHGDVTVIPVARVGWGFGGGAGRGGRPGDPEGGSGEGGGGGGSARPVGYIEITGTGTGFRPIPDPSARWPLVLAGGIAASFVLRGIRGLIRR